MLSKIANRCKSMLLAGSGNSRSQKKRSVVGRPKTIKTSKTYLCREEGLPSSHENLAVGHEWLLLNDRPRGWVDHGPLDVQGRAGADGNLPTAFV